MRSARKPPDQPATDQGCGRANCRLRQGHRRLDEGWQSSRPSNAFAIIGFSGSGLHRLSGVVIDPAATHGDPASADLQHFEIRVSSTDTSDASFTTVFTGTCAQEAALQRFTLPIPVLARYVADGLLQDDGRRVRFTREGLFLADSVLCDLL